MEYLGGKENKLLSYTIRNNLLSVCPTLKYVEFSSLQNTYKKNCVSMENAKLILSNSKPEQNLHKGL